MPYDELVSDIHTAQGILDLRLHLGKLGKWESPVSNQANILVRAVEETLGFFKANFEGCFPKGSRNCAITMGAGSGKVSFNIALIDSWQASYDELDAALSMCVYSSSPTKQHDFAGDSEHDSHSMTEGQPFQAQEDDLAVNFPCVQVLGPSTEAMGRDLELWLPAGIVDGQTMKERLDEQIDQMKTRHIGHSGQWDERDNEEKSTDNKSSQSTVSSHDGQREKQDNEDKRTRHQGPWLTASSHEEPEREGHILKLCVGLGPQSRTVGWWKTIGSLGSTVRRSRQRQVEEPRSLEFGPAHSGFGILDKTRGVPLPHPSLELIRDPPGCPTCHRSDS